MVNVEPSAKELCSRKVVHSKDRRPLVRIAHERMTERSAPAPTGHQMAVHNLPKLGKQSQ